MYFGKKFGAGLSTAVFLCLIVLAGCVPEFEEAGAYEMPPVPVEVVSVTFTDVPVYEDYPGRVRGAREVDVWARVQGILEERFFEEGGLVEAGARLFRIERAPFEVAVKMAEADLATARAALRQAEREWQRASNLYEQNAVSARERDIALGAQESAQAQVQAAAARLEHAELELSYTDVVAPQTGVAGLEAVPEGSLVGPGTLLTSIVQLDPVHVHFSMPEQDAMVHRNGTAGGLSSYQARLLLPTGEEYAVPGTVDFTASTVNPQTGTLLSRGVFANPEGVLVPGQFVRVRLLLRRFEEVAAIPEHAVGEGPAGPQVFLAGDEGTAVARPVVLGPVVPEGQLVISGLEPGDRLIVGGLARLHEGAVILVAGDEVSGDDGGEA